MKLKLIVILHSDLATRFIKHAHEQLHTAAGQYPLRYPHETNSSEDVRGAITHSRLVNHLYEQAGHLPFPEHQEYELDVARSLAQSYETNSGDIMNQVKLTKDNTRPVRIHVNYDMLFEDKVKDDRLCFKLGAWYKIGVPVDQAPTDEEQSTCHRSWRSTTQTYTTASEATKSTDCWAVCGPADTMTDKNRECIISETNAVLDIAGKYLRVPKLKDGRLKLSYSDGSYPAYFQMTGAVKGTECFADCAKNLHVSAMKTMPESYCSQGVDADVILFMQKPISKPMVAGFGGKCARWVFAVDVLFGSLCFL